ncbi:MAG: sugar transferase, partial [Flavisolibacter sp.]
MQIENLKEVTKIEVRPYLRVAAIDKKTSFCYLYIGNNLDSARVLRNGFKSGYTAPDLDEAQKMLKTAASVIDVIIIDIHCQKSELKSFHFFLASHLLDRIPVLFNDSQMNGSRLEHMDYIDDVIDLNNWQFDFYNKVSFLKKLKTNDSIVPVSGTKFKSGPWSKRLFDIVFAASLLILILPVLVLIAIAIRLESKGPIFYTAKRAGRGFRIFNFYKFRTMVVNADKKIQDLAHLNQYADQKGGASFFKISNDPRITKVGKFLRNTS